ncbi:MAG: acyl carrier protein [Lachnospiraceae bacterium]|nr:acyl carrier protein [Lachnospiraceae bacterium]
MDGLMQVLKLAAPKVDWSVEGNLVEEGILDSVDIISVVSELTSAYDIEIPAEEMEIENFCSAQAIYDLVQRLLDE